VSNIQQAPDVDPVLSSGAMKLRRKKLDNLPWDHSGSHPGSPLFWQVILIMVRTVWAYIFRGKQADALPPFEGGRVFTPIHINGLVDPLVIVHNQDRRIITMGRHDLMTMPLIGWITRRMGSQPVIRRPEIEGGVSDEAYARTINHRTLLTMTNCIAAGHNAVVMPEGKSHQDSRLHRFRTGTMRFALNAAAIAAQKGLPPPAFQPVGLHYRCHYWFRTDFFIEFPKPISIETPPSAELGQRLIVGEWVEPPSDEVNRLRDELFDALSVVTPDAPDWETYRAWHLIGHIRAIDADSRLGSFRDEVLAAREVREALASNEQSEEIVEPARIAADILHANDLDGRSLDNGGLRTRISWVSCITGLLMMLITAPIVLPSTGVQAFFAWYLGNRTDEGVDARTTYHMIAAMFSPVLLWPPIALAFAILTIGPTWMILPSTFAIMLVFYISNLIFLCGYDLWSDYSASRRSAKLSSSTDGARVVELLARTRSKLNVLK